MSNNTIIKNIVLHPSERGVENKNIILLPETRKQKASDINSENVADHYVLTAKGNGTAIWELVDWHSIQNKPDMPVRIAITNLDIEDLPSGIVDLFEIGDLVIKEVSSGKYEYNVKYIDKIQGELIIAYSGGNTTEEIYYKKINGTWTFYDKIVVDLTKKEDTANKVTSISDQSTDIQYPSAKLLYDSLLVKMDADMVQIDTTANWNAKISYIPKNGAIIIYSDYKTITVGGIQKLVPGVKIADGKAFVVDLPFITAAEEQALFEHVNNSALHLRPGDREFWNNKLNYTVDVASGTLIFNRN